WSLLWNDGFPRTLVPGTGPRARARVGSRSHRWSRRRRAARQEVSPYGLRLAGDLRKVAQSAEGVPHVKEETQSVSPARLVLCHHEHFVEEALHHGGKLGA